MKFENVVWSAFNAYPPSARMIRRPIWSDGVYLDLNDWCRKSICGFEFVNHGRFPIQVDDQLAEDWELYKFSREQVIKYLESQIKSILSGNQHHKEMYWAAIRYIKESEDK